MKKEANFRLFWVIVRALRYPSMREPWGVFCLVFYVSKRLWIRPSCR